MTRDELVKLRESVLNTVAEMDMLGDYDVNAPRVRATAKALLALIEHNLERMRRRS